MLPSPLHNVIRNGIIPGKGAETMNTKFSERLKELRKDQQKTQDELSKVLNVRRSTYGEYERGKIRPPAEKIFKLAKYFNVSIDYLIGNTEHETIH